MPSDSKSDTHIVLFVPDLGEVPTQRRAEGFQQQNFMVSVFGFRRGVTAGATPKSYPQVDLGKTHNGRYLARALALIMALPELFRHRKTLAAASHYYARNIDQLILALLARTMFNSQVSVTYEVLDIPAIFVGRGLLSQLARTLESFCLKKVSLLVLSSPGFFKNFYGPIQNYSGPWFLLENKPPIGLYDQAAPFRRAHQTMTRDREGYKWVVGYFGTIRGMKTFELIKGLARRMPEDVLFVFRGVLTTVEREQFLSALMVFPNIIYEGDYRLPQDWSNLYGGVDLAWAIDLEHEQHNSRWLLPCRFYEAGAFGVPCITARGFEVGNLVDRLNVGWSFEGPLLDSLENFFKALTPETYAQARDRLLHRPLKDIFDVGDSRELADVLTNPRLRQQLASSGFATSSVAS